MKTFNPEINISNKIELFPYINVYRSAIKNPDRLVKITKQSENMGDLFAQSNGIGPFIDAWDTWYLFGEKARLSPHKETYQITTLNNDHLNMLSDEENKIFYEQQNFYLEIEKAIDTVLEDYISEWLSKNMDDKMFSSDWHGKRTVFPDHIKDWDFKNRDSKWIRASYDLLKHNAETDKSKDYAINFHTDNKPSSDNMPGPKMILTVTIYLNDDYEGGEVSFLNEAGAEVITYKPKAGDITVFPSYKPFYHAAMPVSGGNKYLIRYFHMYMYDGSNEYKKGLEEFGEKAWAKMQEYRVLAEDRSGMHDKNVVLPGEDQIETFKKWRKIYELQQPVVKHPFFAEKITYIDGRKID
jgi:hypothetical protein